MAVRPEDMFEIGLVVADLEAAMDELSAVYGLTFTPIFEGVLPMRDAAGDSAPLFRMAYSREFPHLELIEEQPGTHLTAPAGTALHHLGAWVDDLRTEAAELESKGMPMVLAGVVEDDSPAMWSYHMTSFGTLIELVSRDGKKDFDTLVYDGSVPEVTALQNIRGTKPASAKLAGSQ